MAAAAVDDRRAAADWFFKSPEEVTDADLRRWRREVSDREAPQRAAYRAGRDAGGRRSSSSAARRRTRAPRTARTAARQLARPVTTQVIAGWKLVGLILAVIALYHFLRFAEAAPDTFGRFVQGPAKALSWLADPTRSIPYGATATTD